MEKNTNAIQKNVPRPATGFGAAFLAGALAGAVLSGATVLALSLGLVTRLVPTLLADRLNDLAGPTLIESIVQAIGPLGKQLLFVTVLFGQIAVGGLLAWALVALVPVLRPANAPRVIADGRQWPGFVLQLSVLGLGTVVWLVVVLLVLPILNAGFLGSNLDADQGPLLLWTFVLFQLYSLALNALYPLFARPKPLPEATTLVTGRVLTRRRLIIGLGVLVAACGGLVASVGAFQSVVRRRTDLGVVNADGSVTGEITPNDVFYHVSKNALDPHVDATTGSLTVGGSVAHPRSYSLADIMAAPSHTQIATLTCISNVVGGDLISTAQWVGVPLKTLLDAATPTAAVKRIVFRCADGYTDSIALADAEDPRTLLAYHMNGVALPPDHGYPVRIVVPGIYGMKNVKWVTTIEAVETDYLGYWQSQGWNNDARIKTASVITAPTDLAAVPSGQPLTVRGYAFAGKRGITQVALSNDNGATWHTATLRPPLSDLAWTLWQYTWMPTHPGSYTLTVRAQDGEGTWQTAEKADTFPSGSSGYHRISLQAT